MLCRFFLLVSTLVAASLASEDVFLNWAKEQGRQYHTRAELTKRRAIFNYNYNRMVEHNKEFAAGRVSWARGVNQWYDLTEERSGQQSWDWVSFFSLIDIMVKLL